MKNIEDQLLTIQDLTVLYNEPLSRYTGFRTGGCSTVLIPQTYNSFLETLNFVRANEVKFYILGNGSNVVALDEGYNGFVILTKKALQNIEVNGTFVSAGAGVLLSDLCRKALDHSLSGLEFAYGIPGTIGGAVFMNAGAYGFEIKDVLREVTVLDENNNIVSLPVENLLLSYRNSIFHERKGCIILSATFGLSNGCKEDIFGKMTELLQKRKEKQPLDFPSCGSTFKRPEGSYASKLIDDCGLKGLSLGGAEVSAKHAGFVINKGGATTSDILGLCSIIQTIVKERTGFNLELELEILH